VGHGWHCCDFQSGIRVDSVCHRWFLSESASRRVGSESKRSIIIPVFQRYFNLHYSGESVGYALVYLLFFLVILIVWNPFLQGNGDKIQENPTQEEKGRYKKKNKNGRRVKQN